MPMVINWVLAVYLAGSIWSIMSFCQMLWRYVPWALLQKQMINRRVVDVWRWFWFVFWDIFQGEGESIFISSVHPSIHPTAQASSVTLLSSKTFFTTFT